jgi:hypothetical protein
MSPKVSQPGIGRKLVDNHVLGCARQHGLAPVRQIAQPRSAIDRRTGVVAFIAQLYLAGMHADAQPDRRKRCPLQLKRARHRVGRAGERRHKTVALALFHRPHSAMGGDDFGDSLVEACDRGGHLLELGLPQPR